MIVYAYLEIRINCDIRLSLLMKNSFKLNGNNITSECLMTWCICGKPILTSPQMSSQSDPIVNNVTVNNGPNLISFIIA